MKRQSQQPPRSIIRITAPIRSIPKTAAAAPLPEEFVVPKVLPPPVDPPRLNRLLEEIVNWKKRVNLKLQQTAVTQQFLHDVLQELKASRAPALAPASLAPAPALALGPSTLTVVSTSKHVTTTHFSPDKSSRIGEYIAPDTKLELYEPWTENETGLWMRTKTGNWFQLWNRLTNTYFAV